MGLVQQFLSNQKATWLVLLILLVANDLLAATYYSIKNGNFNNNKTWSATRNGNKVNYPGAGHTYIIQSGYNINLNNNFNVGQVNVESGGTLTVNGNRKLTSPLTIDSGGTMVLTNNRKLTMIGDLTNSGSITTTTGSIVMDTYSFTNSGTVSISTTGSIERTSGSLTNSGTITMGTGQFTSTTGTFTNTNSGTLTITGAATVTLGTGNFINNNTSADVDFGSVDIDVDGTSQSIGGFTTTGLFSNTNATGTITLTGNVIAGGFTNNGAGSIDLGTGKTHTINGDWTITAGTVLGNTSTLEVSGTASSAGTFTANTGTVAFNGTGAQTIPALDYYNLNLTGGLRELASSGTIGIANIFTPGAGGFTITGSTVHFNGNSPQIIPAFNFNNLNASGGNRTLANSGAIGIAGVFTPGAGSYAITGSTVNFNGSGPPQTIPVFNYNHLDGTGGDRIFDNSGTIGIAGNFTPGAGTYTITGSTVNLNGSGAQTLSGTKTFYNLTLSNAGTKTLGTTTINNILSMEGTATAAATPTYGLASTLKYNTSIARTAGPEWLSPFTGSGGVIIANTGAISTNGNKVFDLDVPLNINPSATLTPAAGNTFSFGGDFINDGTWTTSTGDVTIALTRATQNIGRFSTSGTINMTKASGEATFTGNINGGGIAFSGAGILSLGSGLVHVITGSLTGSASTVNGNTSTIRIGSAVAALITFNPNTGTVDFNGTIPQTIPAITYYNLQTSGASTKSLNGLTVVQGVFTNNSGTTFLPKDNVMTLSGAGTPLVNAGTFTAGTSTLNFTNAGSVNIPALDYYNLNGTGGPRVLAGSGEIGIANIFTPGLGPYTVTGSTVSFNGSVAQTIPEFTFYDVILTNASDKFIDTPVSVKNLTIETGSILNLNSSGGGALNLYIW